MLISKEKKEYSYNKEFESCCSIPDILRTLSSRFSDVIAVRDVYSNIEYTYSQLNNAVKQFAGGLQKLGLQKGTHVSLFSENSAKWLIADQAVLLAGGVDAVRGAQAPTGELIYIIQHSETKGLILENFKLFSRLENSLKELSLDFIIILSDEEIASEYRKDFNLYNFNEIISLGKDSIFRPVSISRNDLATLIYTSGTTGKPKGVMLSHGNILSQIKNYTESLNNLIPGESALCILPTWHAYARTSEYYLLSKGITLNYTNLVNFKNDIKKYKPDYLIAVPRLIEAVYSGITTEIKKLPVKKQNLIKFFLESSESYIKAGRTLNKLELTTGKSSVPKKIKAVKNLIINYLPHKLANNLIYSKFRQGTGGNIKQIISGGGALATHLEDFYEMIGINITVGYGLTESSPVLTHRLLKSNLKGSAGKPIPETEIKIVDPETFKELPNYKTGLVIARGPQVMKGYFKDNEATSKVLSSEGWLNTGDLGWVNDNKDLILTGRAKDIIVLSNGENIEPQPIEDSLLNSPYIDQIVLVGQDKSYLGALITPNIEAVSEWAKQKNLKYHDNPSIVNSPDIQKLFKKEINFYSQGRTNFRVFEKVQKFKLLEEPFTIENGLMTQTMKIRKNEVQKRYKNLIEELY